MTMQILSGLRIVPCLGPGRHFGITPAIVTGLLAVASLALVQNEVRDRWTAYQADLSTEATSPTATATVDVAASIDVSAPVRLPAETAAVNTRDAEAINALSDSVARRYRVSSDAMRDVIEAAFGEARRNKLDPLLVLAVIAIESRFNPIAQSQMGALGLMQVIPRFHTDKIDDPDTVLDPEVNIRVGTQVLKHYIARGGSEVAGLQLYNGSSDMAGGYAQKVNAERQRLATALKRTRGSLRVHPVT